MKTTHVLTILNNKGGVSKTTTAINLAAALAVSGKAVLLLDADSQCNATAHVSMKMMKPGAMTLTPFLVNDASDIINAIVSTEIENLDMIMADRDIQASLDVYKNMWARPSERLKEKLAPLDGEVDYIIIDTPPNLTLMVENALAASTHYIIPIDDGSYSEMGLVNLETRILKKVAQINPGLECLGVLPVMMKKGTSLSAIMDEKESFCDGRFNKMPITIPYRQSIINDSHTGSIVVVDGANTDIAKAYMRLAEYVVEQTYSANEGSLTQGVGA